MNFIDPPSARRYCWRRIGISILGLLATAGCHGRDRDLAAVAWDPLPQDPAVEVFFNYNPAQQYVEPYRQIRRPGDDLEAEIVAAIATATRSVEVAVQEFRLPEIARALAERHRAGVRVRVVVENTYNHPWSEVSAAARLDARERAQYNEARALFDENGDGTVTEAEILQRDALKILEIGGVPLLDDTADGSKGSGLMHHKFVIVDGREVLVASANFTTSGIHGDAANPNSRGNANNLLKFRSPELARYFLEEFNLLWGDGPGGELDSRFGSQKPARAPVEVPVGGGKVAVHFSPHSTAAPWEKTSNGAIARALASARGSIDLALFVFSEQRLADTLEARSQAGVTIRAAIDPSFAYRYYSEGLDMLGVALARECKFEADNNPWSTPVSSVGIPALAWGDKLHHKFALIDDRLVVAGSHNWSPSANHQNDETVVVVTNPTVARHFRREFDRLYATVATGVPTKVADKIARQQAECGTFVTHGAAAPTGPVDLNRATATELETLPGIGPSLARQIIATRRDARFSSLEDLQRVPGIGRSKAARLAGLVVW